LAFHRLDASLRSGVHILDVFAVFRRHIVKLVRLVDQRAFVCCFT